MAALRSCPACDGLVPAHATACPHCDRPVGRLTRAARRLAMVAGGTAMLATLMACYGGPPRCAPGTDEDHDHYCTTGRGAPDCNDHDPAIRPLAEDPAGDGIDQNCDGIDGMKPSGPPAAAPPAAAPPAAPPPAAGSATAPPATGTPAPP